MSSEGQQDTTSTTNLGTSLPGSGVEEETVESLIARLRNLGPDEAAKKKSGLTVEQLRLVAKSFNIRKDQKKEDLVRIIFQRVDREGQLEALEAQEEAATGVAFRKTVHTLPRIISLMTRYPVQIMASELQGTREDLQRGETYGNLPVFQELVTLLPGYG